MGKLEEMLRTGGAHIAESMGVGVTRGPGSPAPATSAAPARWQGVAKSKNAVEIPLAKIAPDPDQPREEFDAEALDRLAESLKSRGQLQPIRVRWDEDRETYVVVVGERRWRAARMAGLTTLACVVMEGTIDPGELLAIQLVENAVREDLKPLEQARAFKALIERNGWSARQVARELAIDHTGVARALALLDLPSAVQEQVETGELPPATAYEISKVADPAEQAELAERVVNEGLTRAETVAAVQAAKPAVKRKGGRGRGVASGKARKVTERVFRDAAGCRVTVENRRGVSPETIRAALVAALATVDAESGAAEAA